MFLNSGINKKFYESVKPNFLFKVIKKVLIEEFIEKYGCKICAIKVVADHYLKENNSLIYNYDNEQIQKFQDELGIDGPYRFDKDDLKEIYLEFQTLIRNYSRAVFSVQFTNCNQYYIFNGLEMLWVPASNYITLFNIENEVHPMIDKFKGSLQI